MIEITYKSTAQMGWSFCWTTAFQNCPATKGTLSFTKCPSTEKSWMEAAERKNCSSIPQNCTSPENFRYHCVANAFMNQTIEVCAPGLYLLGFCPEYNFQGERIQDSYNADCKNFSMPCPSRYKSWMSFKYPGCVALRKVNDRSQAPGFQKSDVNKTALAIDVGMQEGMELGSLEVIIMCVCIIVFLTILLGTVIFLLKYTKRRRKAGQSSCMEQEALQALSNGDAS